MQHWDSALEEAGCSPTIGTQLLKVPSTRETASGRQAVVTEEGSAAVTSSYSHAYWALTPNCLFKDDPALAETSAGDEQIPAGDAEAIAGDIETSPGNVEASAGDAAGSSTVSAEEAADQDVSCTRSSSSASASALHAAQTAVQIVTLLPKGIEQQQPSSASASSSSGEGCVSDTAEHADHPSSSKDPEGAEALAAMGYGGRARTSEATLAPAISSHAWPLQTQGEYPMFGVAKSQGHRASMEDAYYVEPLGGLSSPAFFYGVSVVQPMQNSKLHCCLYTSHDGVFLCKLNHCKWYLKQHCCDTILPSMWQIACCCAQALHCDLLAAALLLHMLCVQFCDM